MTINSKSLNYTPNPKNRPQNTSLEKDLNILSLELQIDHNGYRRVMATTLKCLKLCSFPYLMAQSE